MRFFFKVIVVFLIVFNWRVPYTYNTVFISVGILTFYYVFYRKTIPLSFFFQRYIATILIATVGVSFVVYGVTVLFNTLIMNGIQLRLGVMFMMLIAMAYAVPFLVEDKESSAFEEVSLVICYTFALQGLIHFTGYLVPPVGDILFKMQPEALQQRVMGANATLEKFRLYALSGSIFFELPAAYGLACILYFRLLLKDKNFFLASWHSYVIIILLIAGISLTGRTGFVGFFAGFFLWVIGSFNKISAFLGRYIWQIIASGVALVLSFNFLLNSRQQQMLRNDVFPFAFEAFYNWQETGKLRTRSTDTNLSEVFYYPLRDETLLHGHGVDMGEVASVGYRTTDAGYMKTLLFGGVPFLLFMIYYISLYVNRPLSISNRGGTKEDRLDFYCFLILFFYVLALHIKEGHVGLIHIVQTLLLLTGSAYVVRYYSDEEETNEQDG